ncbi:hypothetical protein ACKC9G_17790 [Pokkaliibacter sp. CJK22405]|uniref:hypothetical protein n=1 Tax=Pokkaliibacter sp. CJK22405 TaxID=3384615 RepID=UPI00398568CD
MTSTTRFITLPALGLCALLGWYFTTQILDFEDLVSCGISDDEYRWDYSQELCFFVLRHIPITQGSLEDINENGGLDYVLSGENPAKYSIAEILLNNGLPVDGDAEEDDIEENDDFPSPLVTAIFMNDPRRVGFLLDHGASTLVSRHHHKTAMDLVHELMRKNPGVDRSAVIHLLEQYSAS